MKLSEVMLNDDPIKTWNAKGELLPDPNLIRNIDYLECFIELEIEEWGVHCRTIDEQLEAKSYPICIQLLLSDKNVIKYLKALFDIIVYYMACSEALEKLMAQLFRVSVDHYGLRLKKPKLKLDQAFHEKTKIIRNISFIHQDSKDTSNPMDKRLAMSWWPTLSSKIGVKPTCRDYVFGGGKWWVKVNGVKTETEIDILVEDLFEYSTRCREQLSIRKNRLLEYYREIIHNK